jgi:hypothetical protein
MAPPLGLSLFLARTRSLSLGRGRSVKAVCLLVALFFAMRIEVGLLLPDDFAGADKACECQLEESSDKHDATGGIPPFDVAFLGPPSRGPATQVLSLVDGQARPIFRRPFFRPHAVRGPPA